MTGIREGGCSSSCVLEEVSGSKGGEELKDRMAGAAGEVDAMGEAEGKEWWETGVDSVGRASKGDSFWDVLPGDKLVCKVTKELWWRSVRLVAGAREGRAAAWRQTDGGGLLPGF